MSVAPDPVKTTGRVRMGSMVTLASVRTDTQVKLHGSLVDKLYHIDKYYSGGSRNSQSNINVY